MSGQIASSIAEIIAAMKCFGVISDMSGRRLKWYRRRACHCGKEGGVFGGTKVRTDCTN